MEPMEVVIAIGAAIALVAVIVGILVCSGNDNGVWGEVLVSRRLQVLPNDEYKILNDVMLPTKDGTTTQVDHIVLSRFGIFVVETKDYSGWIFGDEKQRQWTQSLHAGWGDTEKFHFQNPIRQNWRHIYTMAELLELPIRCFHNVVAFAGDAEFKTEMPDYVMYGEDLVRYIYSFTRPILSSETVGKLALAISRFDASLTPGRRGVHVANLRKRHDPTLLAVSFAKGELKCPKCGAKMVLRHRRSDGRAFYGCSAYPQCRSTMGAD